MAGPPGAAPAGGVSGPVGGATVGGAVPGGPPGPGGPRVSRTAVERLHVDRIAPTPGPKRRTPLDRRAQDQAYERSIVPRNRPGWRLRGGLTWPVRKRIYIRLAAQLDAGLKLPAALHSMWGKESRGGRRWRLAPARAVATWRSLLVAGDTGVVGAMGPWLPPGELQTLAAGEPSGRMVDALRRTVSLGDSVAELRAAVRQELRYPGVLMLAAIGMVVLVGEQLMPAFLALADAAIWAAQAPVLYGVYAYYSGGWLWLTLGTLLGLGVGVWYSLSRWVGRLRGFADGFFPYTLYKRMEGVRVMLVLTTLLRLTPDLAIAFKVLQTTGTRYVRSKLVGVIAEVARGEGLADAFAANDATFPSEEILDDMGLYAGLQTDFVSVLEERCASWQEAGQAEVKQLLRVVRFLMMLIVALTVLAILTGMASMPQIIGGTFQAL